jgi:hypothetical protein
MRQRPAGSGASLDEAIRPLIVIAGHQLLRNTGELSLDLAHFLLDARSFAPQSLKSRLHLGARVRAPFPLPSPLDQLGALQLGPDQALFLRLAQQGRSQRREQVLMWPSLS